MASSQNTTHTSYPCPLWGKTFGALVETSSPSPSTTHESYRFIRYESFEQHLSFLKIPKVMALLIREEYDELYNFLSQKSLPTGRIGDAYSGSAVIGHPGIGKSLSLWYTLFRRLCEQKPTAFQYEPDTIWTFNDGEARKHTANGADSGSDLPNGAWGLCDSNAFLRSPSPFISSQNFFTIQATSPQPDRYAQWVKEKGGLRYYMDVFSEREIKQLSHLLQVPRAIDMYHRWGPSARNCIVLAQDEDQERQHAASVREAATSFAWNPPPAPYPGGGLALIAGSHKLFCLRPTTGEKGFLEAQSTVISPHVQLIIQNAVSRGQHEQRKRFYELISVHPHCRSVMGWLLEQQFHKWIGLDREGKGKGKGGVEGADSQVRDAADFLECIPRPQRKRLLALSLQPTREQPLNDIQELATAEGLPFPIYYRPTSERFAGVDGLMITTGAVVLIQVTVSSAHALKREHLVPLYDNLPASVRDKPWKFVWVVPEADVGEALINRKFDVHGNWPTLGFYWCLFRFDTREGASDSLRLDHAGTEIEEDEVNIETWAADEDSGDGDATIVLPVPMPIVEMEQAEPAPLPSTSIRTTRHHEQDDSNASSNKVQKVQEGRKGRKGQKKR